MATPVPAVEPVRVSDLLPTPGAVRAGENLSRPVPACSMIAPVPNPVKLMTLFEVSPVPV